MQTEINYQQLGQRVREKRKAMNVQQKDMAIAIGTATNHLSDIERGRKKPSLELLMRISSFLDTPVDYFLMDNWSSKYTTLIILHISPDSHCYFKRTAWEYTHTAEAQRPTVELLQWIMLENSSFRRICVENTEVASVREGLGILRSSAFLSTKGATATLPL